ncbi:hypothetical protein [Fuerstiella marisgermanici]|nr:hypothetical protein [Fuerstiella marisgermanici]
MNQFYRTTASVDELKTFYAYLLGQRGWKAERIGRIVPLGLEFSKDGHHLSITIESRPGPTSVTITLRH